MRARRLVQRRTVAAGTTTSAATSSAPSADRAATTTSATRATSTPSYSRPRTPSAPAAPGSKPVASHSRPSVRVAASAPALATPASTRSRGSTSSRLPNSSVSTPTPVMNTSLARITPSASIPARPTRRRGVGPEALPAGERGDQERECGRCSQRAQRGGEAEAVREHQSGEGGATDRVGVEGEAAQHDPAAEDPGADREQQHLGHSALDVGQVEGGRQGIHRGEVYQIMGTVLITIAST